MTTAPETGLEIDGRVPELVGLTCDDLLCQEYDFQGRVHNQANVIYLRFGSTWHRLWFDANIVFWRVVDAPDHLGAFDGHTYTLIDLGKQTGVRGARIDDMRLSSLPTATRVRLSFADGHVLTFTYDYGPETCTWEVASV